MTDMVWREREADLADAARETTYTRLIAGGMEPYEAWRRASLIAGGADENDLYAEEDDEGEDD